MTTLQKLGVMTLGIALVTTLILPDRQTPQVLSVAFQGSRGILATAMGTGRQV